MGCLLRWLSCRLDQLSLHGPNFCAGGAPASQQLYAQPDTTQHDSGQAGQAGQAAIRCSHCGSTYTSNGWDKHPHTGERLCHACGQYAGKHGGELPSQELLALREERRQRALGAGEEQWRAPPPPQQRPRQRQQQQQQPLPRPSTAPLQPQPRPPAQQRRCLACGSTSPGSYRRACWCRHPVTRQEWVCHPCYNKIYNQRKKEEARQAALKAEEEEEQEEEEEAVQPSQPGEAQGGRQSLRLLQQHGSHPEPALTAAAHTLSLRAATGGVAALVAAEAAAEAWSGGPDGGSDVGGNQPPPGPDSWEPAVAGGSQQ